MERIQRNIKHLRETRGVTKSRLAEAIGKTPTSIRDYESEKVSPPMAVIQEIADFFGVPIGRMVEEDLWITAPDGRVEVALTDVERRLVREKELLHMELDKRMEEVKALGAFVANCPNGLERLKSLNPDLAKQVQKVLKG